MSEFGKVLRQAREDLGMSLREFGRLVCYSHVYLWQLEQGQKRPSRDTAERLDRALRADGVLVARFDGHDSSLAVDRMGQAAGHPEVVEQIAHAVTRPLRIDASLAPALDATLREYRYLDDLMPAELLLPSVQPLYETIRTLAHEARGRAALDLQRTTALWTQTLGWLLAEARHDGEAVHMLARAEEDADQVGDGTLIAQVANFRGYLARQQGRPAAIVRHFLTAYHTPGAARLQRVGDAIQAAHGYALLDNQHEARTLLIAAEQLADNTDDDHAPEAAYWLTHEFCRMNLGLAHLELGNPTHATGHLQAGLDALPPGHAASEWAGEYRQALARAGC